MVPMWALPEPITKYNTVAKFAHCIQQQGNLSLQTVTQPVLVDQSECVKCFGNMIT